MSTERTTGNQLIITAHFISPHVDKIPQNMVLNSPPGYRCGQNAKMIRFLRTGMILLPEQGYYVRTVKLNWLPSDLIKQLKISFGLFAPFTREDEDFSLCQGTFSVSMKF